MFSRLLSLIKGVIRKLIPYKDIEQVEHIESPLSPEMIEALDKWYLLYLNKAPWLKAHEVKSRNLPAFLRQYSLSPNMDHPSKAAPLNVP